MIWNQPSSIISPRGKGSQICFQGQVTEVEDLIPTNQKWIWMNEHTKFYLHNIDETYEFNGWLLEFVSGELESKRFRRNSTTNNRLCLLVVV